jgi:hypothetical protein
MKEDGPILNSNAFRKLFKTDIYVNADIDGGWGYESWGVCYHGAVSCNQT